MAYKQPFQVTFLHIGKPHCICSSRCVGRIVGVARGSGWQHIGAYVNLGAYYLVGIPVALVLGFVMHLKGQGLWCGLVAGAATQSLLLGIITFRSDWEKQVHYSSVEDAGEQPSSSILSHFGVRLWKQEEGYSTKLSHNKDCYFRTILYHCFSAFSIFCFCLVV